MTSYMEEDVGEGKDAKEDERDTKQPALKRTRTVVISGTNLRQGLEDLAIRQSSGGIDPRSIWRVPDAVLSEAAGFLTLKEYLLLLRTSKSETANVRRANARVEIDHTTRCLLSTAKRDKIVQPHASWATQLVLSNALDCITNKHFELWNAHPWRLLHTLEVNTWRQEDGQKLLDLLDLLLRPGATFRSLIFRTPGLKPPAHNPDKKEWTTLLIDKIASKGLRGPSEWLALCDLTNQSTRRLLEYLKATQIRPCKLELHFADQLTHGLVSVLAQCGNQLQSLRLAWKPYLYHVSWIADVIRVAKLGPTLTELQLHGDMGSAIRHSTIAGQCPNVRVFLAGTRTNWHDPDPHWKLERATANAISFKQASRPYDLSDLETVMFSEVVTKENMEQLTEFLKPNPNRRPLKRISCSVQLGWHLDPYVGDVTDIRHGEWPFFANLVAPWYELSILTRTETNLQDYLATVVEKACKTLHRLELEQETQHWSWMQKLYERKTYHPSTAVLRHLKFAGKNHVLDSWTDAKSIANAFPRLETLQLWRCSVTCATLLFDLLPALRLVFVHARDDKQALLTPATVEETIAFLSWKQHPDQNGPRPWCIDGVSFRSPMGNYGSGKNILSEIDATWL
jgi:hypothetical protein